ncbi:hypothetical protein L6452_26250 [Arctium lappa]|uniref:Uncharacterized protein n=1 Tax=Arctium lappa TaxID=4217 RepID=A0ACB9ACR9_ARCLA|nr:hypothetical protein L6452_26250 [Arctium lappa]
MTKQRLLLTEDSHGVKLFNGRVWVPKVGGNRELLLKDAHKSKYSIHPGSTKMYKDLKQHYWWPIMKLDVARYVERFDRLTKSAHILSMRETLLMDKLAKLYIDEVVSRNGVPLSIVSDRNSWFISNFWDGLQKELGTRVLLSFWIILVKFRIQNRWLDELLSRLKMISREALAIGADVKPPVLFKGKLSLKEEVKAKEGESLEATYDRFLTLLNKMKQMKDLNEIPLHEVYETLRQNEEEVEEIKDEKKKVEKLVADPVALVVKKKEKKSQVMLLLTKAFQKKFYKKPGSNSKRYPSGSRNYEHRERVEGKRFEEKQPEEKNYGNKNEEKKEPEPVKCYNCGKVGHYAKDCRKLRVHNSEYYKNKIILAKQQEADKALMAEDEYWLDHLDGEEDKDENAHMCFIGQNIIEANSDAEDSEEVCDMSKSDFLSQMQSMMIKLQDLQSKLKREKMYL